MKDLITIGLPSKGRLKDEAILFFKDQNRKDKSTKQNKLKLG